MKKKAKRLTRAEFEKKIIVNPKKYRRLGNQGVYEFPFETMDKTPGCGNLGRIEWHIELVAGYEKGRRFIKGIHVWASQTRDKRYKGKMFLLNTYCEMVEGALPVKSEHGEAAFMTHVWALRPCDIHRGGIIMSAYPKDEHDVLIIPIDSSIMVQPRFGTLKHDLPDCAGCTDRRSEGTHAMHTRQHPCQEGGDPNCGECFPVKLRKRV